MAAALVLMVLDTLAVFWMGGLFSRRPRMPPRAGRRDRRGAALALGLCLRRPTAPRAQDAKPGDAEAIEAISTTRLAYVLTGDSGIDCDQPRRPRRPVALPDRKDGAGARRAGRRRHRQGRARLLSDHLLADRRQRRRCRREAAIARIDAYMQAGRHGALRHARPVLDRHRRRLGQPGHGAAARHPRQPQRAAAGAGAGRPRADQVLLHPSGVSRPLQRQPALGRGLARRQQHRQPPGAHRRRRHADHDHRQ